MTAARKRRKLWSASVGVAPFLVWVGERPDKDGVVYLRFRPARGAAMRWESLSRRLPTSAAEREVTIAECLRLAAARHAELIADPALALQERALQAVAERQPLPALRLADTWPILTHPDTGAYPHDTPHRREVGRALDHAVRILGGHQTWTALGRAEYTQLYRTRIRELRQEAVEGRVRRRTGTAEQAVRVTSGRRSGEILVQRVAAIAASLRDQQLIPSSAAILHRKWKEELRAYVEQLAGSASIEPERLRYSWEESLQLIRRSHDVDPRLGLLLEVAAALRHGQVVRCRRSDLDLAREQLTVRGRGKKQGALVLFTARERAAVDRALAGYLRLLEAAYQAGTLADYHLFPAGQLTGARQAAAELEATGTITTERVARLETAATHLRRSSLDAMWDRLEALCGIQSVPGRGRYGLRRAHVDAGKAQAISREGLRALGGWADTQVPDQIYAEQEQRYAAEEARRVRAALHQEPEQDPSVTRSQP